MDIPPSKPQFSYSATPDSENIPNTESGKRQGRRCSPDAFPLSDKENSPLKHRLVTRTQNTRKETSSSTGSWTGQEMFEGERRSSGDPSIPRSTTPLSDRSNTPSSDSDDVFLASHPASVPINIDTENLVRGRSLGSGGEAEVRELKWIKPSLHGLDSPGALVLKSPSPRIKRKESIAEAVTSIQRESKLLQEIGHHPNIVTSYGMHFVDDVEGSIIEKIPGFDLEGMFDGLDAQHADGSVSDEDYWGALRFITEEVLCGLAHITDRGFVHADIKPSNLRFDEQCRKVRIIDFGRACRIGTPVKPGHENYCAPEVLAGIIGKPVKANETIDCYSMGQLLYHRLMYNPETTNSSVFFGHREQSAFAIGHRESKVFFMDRQMEAYAKEANTSGYKLPVPPEDYPYYPHLTDLLNQLLHPLPESRISAHNALQHPFITHRTISDAAACRIIEAAKARADQDEQENKE